MRLITGAIIVAVAIAAVSHFELIDRLVRRLTEFEVPPERSNL